MGLSMPEIPTMWLEDCGFEPGNLGREGSGDWIQQCNLCFNKSCINNEASSENSGHWGWGEPPWLAVLLSTVTWWLGVDDAVHTVQEESCVSIPNGLHVGHFGTKNQDFEDNIAFVPELFFLL